MTLWSHDAFTRSFNLRACFPRRLINRTPLTSAQLWQPALCSLFSALFVSDSHMFYIFLLKSHTWRSCQLKNKLYPSFVPAPGPREAGWSLCGVYVAGRCLWCWISTAPDRLRGLLRDTESTWICVCVRVQWCHWWLMGPHWTITWCSVDSSQQPTWQSVQSMSLLSQCEAVFHGYCSFGLLSVQPCCCQMCKCNLNFEAIESLQTSLVSWTILLKP